MQINILRGKDNIGENLIEVRSINACILLECGTALEETNHTKAVEETVLKTHYDAVIITHSHADHSGLLAQAVNADKIYMGEDTKKILTYIGTINESNLLKVETYESGNDFCVKDIKITSYLCDHSAYDSYMLNVTCNGETLLYTGDFRSNGRKSFDGLLKKLPTEVDYLICEGTNIRSLTINISERQLEEKAAELMSEDKPVFVLQSTTNIDRYVSFYRASKRAKRKFIVNKSNADIACLLKNIPNPIEYNDCYVCTQYPLCDDAHAELKHKYGKKFIGKSQIIKARFCMLVGANSIYYLKWLASVVDLTGATLIYSLWKGYKEQANMMEFLAQIDSLGINIVSLHTSGHADNTTIAKLKAHVHAKQEITVYSPDTKNE